MRSLNKNEKVLLNMILLLGFIMVNLLGFHWLSQGKANWQSKKEQAEIEKADAEKLLAEKDFWFKRKEWLDQKQPHYKKGASVNTIKGELLDELKKSAATHQLTVARDVYGEDDASDPSVRMDLTGSLESLIQWLAEVQQPEKFQAVTAFNLKLAGGESTSKVICTITVSRCMAAGETKT